MQQLVINIDENRFAVLLQFLKTLDYIKIVEVSPAPVPVKSASSTRCAGFSKAKFRMAADFNAPLDDFKEYME